MISACKKEFRTAGDRAEPAYLQPVPVDRIMLKDVVLFKITRIVHKIIINREVADLDIRIGNNIFEIDRLPVATARINQIRIHGFTSIYCLYVSNPAAS